ncbi:MAG: hypothetical protein AAFO69_20980, partial [Bacteroidota bacterium]
KQANEVLSNLADDSPKQALGLLDKLGTSIVLLDCLNHDMVMHLNQLLSQANLEPVSSAKEQSLSVEQMAFNSLMTTLESFDYSFENFEQSLSFESMDFSDVGDVGDSGAGGDFGDFDISL